MENVCTYCTQCCLRAHYGVLQCVAVCRNMRVLQCVAVCYSASRVWGFLGGILIELKAVPLAFPKKSAEFSGFSHVIKVLVYCEFYPVEKGPDKEKLTQEIFAPQDYMKITE